MNYEPRVEKFQDAGESLCGIHTHPHRNCAGNCGSASLLTRHRRPSILRHMTKKRTDYISWDDYFMAVAQLSAHRSKDPGTQVGACIVNKNKRIIGIGYNGFPSGLSDDDLPWDREGAFLDTKYPYVCHAEMNAITNSSNKPDLDGSTMYVSLYPCNECAKLIVQSGIREVVYLSDKYAHDDKFIAAQKIFKLAGVKTRQLVPVQKTIVLSLEE
jgi:dCMP deaminase